MDIKKGEKRDTNISVSNDNKTSKYYIINSMFFAIFILLFLIYFKNSLPNYTEYVYIIISVLFMIISGLILSEKQNLIIKISYLSMILLPLYILSYIHIRYRDIINDTNIKLDTYNSLINVSTTLFLFQIIIMLLSFESKNMTNIYGSIIITLCNMVCTGLIWREVAFFITNG